MFIFAIYLVVTCWRVKELGNYYSGSEVDDKVRISVELLSLEMRQQM